MLRCRLDLVVLSHTSTPVRITRKFHWAKKNNLYHPTHVALKKKMYAEFHTAAVHVYDDDNNNNNNNNNNLNN